MTDKQKPDTKHVDISDYAAFFMSRFSRANIQGLLSESSLSDMSSLKASLGNFKDAQKKNPQMTVAERLEQIKQNNP